MKQTEKVSQSKTNRRLKGYEKFIPSVWLCRHVCYDNFSDKEAEEFVKQNFEGFLFLLGVEEEEGIDIFADESDSCYIVSFFASVPTSDSKPFLLDNGNLNNYFDISFGQIRNEIVYRFYHQELLGFQHENPVVNIRVQSMIDFLCDSFGDVDKSIYGEDSKQFVRARQNAEACQKRVSLQEAFKNLVILAQTKEMVSQKDYTKIIQDYFYAHPSKKLKDFEAMLVEVENLNLSTRGMKRMRALVNQGKKQEGLCVWCGKVMTFEYKLATNFHATWEHMIPKSKGGDEGIENCLLACKKCNNDRGDIEISDWVMLCLQRNKTVQFGLLSEFFLQ